MLEKTGVWSHTNRVELMASSPQPLKSIGKGSQGLRDYEAEKGLILVDGCVDFLEVRLTLV